MVDREGRIVLLNREIERLFAYAREELLGRSLEVLVPEGLRASHPGFRDGFFDDPSVRAMGAGRDLYGRRKDGVEIPVEIGLTPVATEEGALVLAAVADISERKRAESARRQLEEQLRHSQKMQAVGTLAGGVAHGFNNVLAAITAYAELMRDEAPSPALREDAELILESCQRGTTIVERILAFSRRRDIQLRPVAVTDVVETAETLLRATLPASVRIQVESEGHDRVMADQPSLEQVVMSLATNSAQAMPDGGILRLRVEPFYLTDSRARAHPTLGEGQYVALQVEDDGIGIEERALRRVFEPFYTTKEPGFGTGLGLAVVDGIVTEHGGAVSIESTVGRGTSVRCLFPALDPDGLDSRQPGSPTNRSSMGRGEHILVIDDEPVLVAAVERRLRALGYRVTAFSDSRDALDAFAVDPGAYALVLTDYTMPEMTGIELAGKITAIRADVPIVLVTGFVQDLDPFLLDRSGVAGVLRKPTTVEEMADELRRVLDAPRVPPPPSASRGR